MQKFQIYFFIVLFLAVLFLSFQIFLPFLVPLLVAATLAILFHPLHERMARLFGERRGPAAFFTVIVAVFVIILPLSLIGAKVFHEAIGLSTQLNAGGAENIAHSLSSIEKQLSDYFPALSLNFDEYLRLGGDWLAKNVGAIFAGIAKVTVNLLFDLFIGIIAFYYFLKDGKKLIQAIVGLSPLPDKHDYEILERLERTVGSVVRGSLTIAVIQGILVWIGFTLFGVPNPALFGSVAAITALIPGVGTSLVLIPAIIYLFVVGPMGNAIGLLIWGMVFVGLIDNMLSPFLMEKGIKIHPFFILLSVMGGLIFFGPVGFLLGPLVLSLLFAMIEIYRFLMDSERKSFSKV